MTHEPMCPCNKADERGCFLISAETGKCISCVCGDKMGAYLDGYAAGVQAAREAVAALPANQRRSNEDGMGGYVQHADGMGTSVSHPETFTDYLTRAAALAAIDGLRGES